VIPSDNRFKAECDKEGTLVLIHGPNYSAADTKTLFLQIQKVLGIAYSPALHHKAAGGESPPSSPQNSGTKKCPGCSKTVYFAEKADGVKGEWWHKLCFKCAEPQCKVALSAGNFQDHDGKLYCKRCYNSQFTHQGYGHGGLQSFTDPYGVHPDSELVTSDPPSPSPNNSSNSAQIKSTKSTQSSDAAPTSDLHTETPSDEGQHDSHQHEDHDEEGTARPGTPEPF